MKSILLLLACTISTTLFAQTIYPSGVAGCIARWTFDSPEGGILTTIDDVSGNNNNGSNNFITSTTGWKGYSGTAGAFDGTSSFSQVPYNNLFNLTEMTVFSLIKFDGFFSGSCQGNNIIYNGFNYNSDLNWALYTTDGNYDGSCNAYNPMFNKANYTTPNFVNNTIPLNNFIDSSKWYLLACTFKGTDLKYYQIEMNLNNYMNNITPSYTALNPNAIGNGNYDIFMGATQNPPFPYWFNGKMDEVILFNKALSDSEIQSVYDYLFGPIPSATASPTLTPTLFTTSSTPTELVIQTQEQAYSYELYNTTGQLLQKNDHLQGIQHIDISKYASSLFILKMTTNKQQTQVIKCSH